jgi:hypothetical protein
MMFIDYFRIILHDFPNLKDKIRGIYEGFFLRLYKQNILGVPREHKS